MGDKDGDKRATGLSADRIVAAALELVDREGWNALSMRRLAQELDVWPMAFYRYFRDKDELLQAVTDAATRRVALPDEHGSWRTQLLKLLRATREALQHPGTAAVTPARTLMTPGGLRLTDRALRILDGAGMERHEAVIAWRALFALMLGSTALGDSGARAQASREARAAIAILDEEELPAVQAAVTELSAQPDAREQLDYGVERLLDGIEPRLRVARQ